MEVHHHVKQNDHADKKKGGHLFFEFFMLFFAVFTGSVAEFFLEHVVEHNKEVQYIESLVEDLKLDTTNYTRTIENNTRLAKGIDSLLDLMQQPNIVSANDSIVKRLYLLNLRYTSNIYDMPFSTRTITQLKSAGNMRLIHKISISDSIMNYDQAIQTILIQEKVKNDGALANIHSSNELFDGKFIRPSNFKSKADFLGQKFKLLNRDSMKMKYYYNNLLFTQQVMYAYIEMLADGKQQAANLIPFLYKEYGITEDTHNHHTPAK